MIFAFLLTLKVVTVSIPPLASLVKFLGGDKFEVYTITSRTQNPHTYELKPSDLKKVSKADLYIEVGEHIEGWGSRLCSVSKNCVRLAKRLREMGVNYNNPHIWLDPKLVPYIAQIISEELVKLEPAESLAIKWNLKRFNESFGRSLTEIDSLLKPLKGLKVLVYHPSWTPFLSYFGLEVVGAFVHHGEKEPSVKEYGEWLTRMKKEGVRIVVSEVNMPSRVIRQLAKEGNACLVMLDPLFEGDFIQNFKNQAYSLVQVYERCH